MELEGGAGHKEWKSHKLERNPSPGEETGRRGTHSLFFFSLEVARPWAATSEPAGEDFPSLSHPGLCAGFSNWVGFGADSLGKRVCSLCGNRSQWVCWWPGCRGHG